MLARTDAERLEYVRSHIKALRAGGAESEAIELMAQSHALEVSVAAQAAAVDLEHRMDPVPV